MGCGCELVGQLIVGDGTTDPVLSSPRARGGNGLIAVIDVTVFDTASAALEVLVQHKNSSDTTWGTAFSFSSITGTGVYTASGSGIKETVRTAYVFGMGAAAGDVVRYVERLVFKPY